MNAKEIANAELDTRPPLPLVFARSSLFGLSGDEETSTAAELACAKTRSSSLSYSGPRLRQWHSFLWQAVIQKAVNLEINDQSLFVVTASELADAIGMKADTRLRRRIFAALKEMTQGRVTVKTISHSYSGPLLLKVGRQLQTNHLGIKLPDGLLQLLKHEVLHNDLARKKRFRKQPLASWLHDYLATHLIVPPERVETLRQWSGTSMKISEFRRQLRSALRLLAEGPRPLVSSWHIDQRDRLFVVKSGTRVILAETAPVVAKMDAAAAERNLKAKGST